VKSTESTCGVYQRCDNAFYLNTTFQSNNVFLITFLLQIIFNISHNVLPQQFLALKA